MPSLEQVSERIAPWSEAFRYVLWVLAIFFSLSLFVKFEILGTTVSKILAIILGVMIFTIANLIPVLLIFFLARFLFSSYGTVKEFYMGVKEEYQNLSRGQL